jgi:hypothetical protein
MSVASDLRQRLVALRSRLHVLIERRERASGEHSFARARQRAGVTDHDADEMAQFSRDELAGDAEMTDLRREIKSVDDELLRDHGMGLRARAGRALRSTRRRWSRGTAYEEKLDRYRELADATYRPLPSRSSGYRAPASRW